MGKMTPQEVYKAIAADFKRYGITYQNAAEVLGYTNKQTVANILSGKKYMAPEQAKKFHDKCGYDIYTLMTGEGELIFNPTVTVSAFSTTDGSAIHTNSENKLDSNIQSNQTSPEEVYKNMKIFFKKNHIKQKDIQKILNYNSPQAVSNLFRTLDRYLNRHQAETLCKAYNFNFEYLTKGEGTLIKKNSMPECVTVTGRAKDQFYSYVFEVFQKTAFALQNKDVTLIFSELNNLAFKLNLIEKNGNFSDEETKIVIKLSKTLIDNILPNVK